jgi:type III restriction enzyme
LAEQLIKLIAERSERIKVVAADLQVKAEEEMARLRSLGWTQADFAKALKSLLETREAE